MATNSTRVVTYERLRELLDYDPETGVFTWKRGSGRVRVGDRAGCDTQLGYRTTGIDGRLYKEHRLAWLYVHGHWPAQQIDHINGVKDDNRIANLRDVSPQINKYNVTRLHRTNTSGYTGVYQSSWGRRRWKACIEVNGHPRYLGIFDHVEDAVAAYDAAKAEITEGVIA